VHIPHRGLDGVVPGDVLQRKSARILPSLGQKRVAKSVKSGIRIGFDLITQTSHLGFQDPTLEFFVWMTGLAEYVPALRFHDQLLSAACGRDFKLGVVLYDAEQTVSFGERMFAVPISCLWA
jgi:hypothetical protein